MNRRFCFLSIVVALLVLTASCKKTSKPSIISVKIANKDYPIVKIGNQLWIASNYDGPGGIAYSETNSKPEYGKYYLYEEVKAVSLPSGWRIPTMDDYVKLAQSQGIIFTEQFRANDTENIKKLTSKTNWLNVQGTNLSGFNAHPGGYSYNKSKPMDGDISEFWMSNGKTFSIQEGANQTLRIVFYENSNNTLSRFNVRFVKDNK